MSFRRLYSTSIQPFANAAATSQGRRFYQNFDKSMYYPIILTVIFGSQLINLMNKQRDFETLERKYSLKLSKIDEIMARIKEEGLANVDVEKELELVNKLFKHGEDSSLIASKKTHSENLQEEEIKEEDLLTILGLNEQPQQAKSTKSTTTKESQEETKPVKLSEMNVSEQIAFEKDLQNYRVKTENHTIVEVPGDYVDAAKDTKIKKFL